LLAASRNLHMGFDPLETDRHICIVIGGPVLTFTSNRFLAGDDRTYGTRELLNRWTSGEVLLAFWLCQPHTSLGRTPG
jgi:hypothetical protein